MIFKIININYVILTNKSVNTSRMAAHHQYSSRYMYEHGDYLELKAICFSSYRLTVLSGQKYLGHHQHDKLVFPTIIVVFRSSSLCLNLRRKVVRREMLCFFI